MNGVALLMSVMFATLGAFFVCWPLAIAFRMLHGKSPPTALREGEPWTLADVVWEACYRLWTGRFLPWTPRRHVPWSWIDMLLIVLPIGVLMVGPLLIGQPARGGANPPALKPAQFQFVVIVDVGLKAAFMLLATAYLVIKAGATPRDLGWSWRELEKNVLIGLATFAMIAPLVYGLQAALVWLGGWKYEHPLIDMLEKNPSSSLFVLLTFSACIMAPLSEEWFFRAVLQGWLERACAWLTSWLAGDRSSPAMSGTEPSVTVSGESLPGIASDGAVIPASIAEFPTAADSLSPHAAPQPAPTAESIVAPRVVEAREEPLPRSILAHWPPILISSVLFGLAHSGQGPAPIPLTVLALALGYVYQRTHSIVPVMVVHALFNGLSMLIFYVWMFEPHLLKP